MVIVIYTKLGALNMVIRMTEKTCGLYENTEVIVETVYIYIYIYTFTRIQHKPRVDTAS